jgi:hypothetical protein
MLIVLLGRMRSNGYTRENRSLTHVLVIIVTDIMSGRFWRAREREWERRQREREEVGGKTRK